jgi:hypothetical protein
MYARTHFHCDIASVYGVERTIVCIPPASDAGLERYNIFRSRSMSVYIAVEGARRAMKATFQLHLGSANFTHYGSMSVMAMLRQQSARTTSSDEPTPDHAARDNFQVADNPRTSVLVNHKALDGTNQRTGLLRYGQRQS